MKESHKKEEARRGESTWPWAGVPEDFLQVDFRDVENATRRFGNAHKIAGEVYNNEQVMAAEDSHKVPISWPWPHGWAWVGTGCH
jgi:hypothetical protein